MQSATKKRVSYYYHDEIGGFYYGENHPMKPPRLMITHELVLQYGLYSKLKVYRPYLAKHYDLTMFHSEEYVNFLHKITPENKSDFIADMKRYNIGGESPVFEGLLNFSKLSAGGSIAAAVEINKGGTDIAINWSGGLHHAKKSEASGFCYINDIVLAILELLKYHQRVLYIDIDVHHGDGVQEAFYTTDRVMTVSFHYYNGVYFPGTGHLLETGAELGKNYAMNIPLRAGINDDSYEYIFVPVMSRIMETYRPNAVVMQCGADSLAGDRLGCFNMTLHGHGKCVEFIRKSNLPLLLLGGGGYTVSNVSRCWTYETAIALGVEIDNALPSNKYYEYFEPDYKLHIKTSYMPNQNNPKYLDNITKTIFEHLRSVPHSPSVQIQKVPNDAIAAKSDSDEDVDKDQRLPQIYRDKNCVPENEYSCSEDEGNGGRRHNRSHKNTKKRHSIMSPFVNDIEDEDDIPLRIGKATNPLEDNK